MLDRKAITVVFANIEDILLTNTVSAAFLLIVVIVKPLPQTFMSSLEERQKDCRLYIDRIGDILQNDMSNMAVYMVGLFVPAHSLAKVLYTGILRQSS